MKIKFLKYSEVRASSTTNKSELQDRPHMASPKRVMFLQGHGQNQMLWFDLDLQVWPSCSKSQARQGQRSSGPASYFHGDQPDAQGKSIRGPECNSTLLTCPSQQLVFKELLPQIVPHPSNYRFARFFSFSNDNRLLQRDETDQRKRMEGGVLELEVQAGLFIQH